MKKLLLGIVLLQLAITGCSSAQEKRSETKVGKTTEQVEEDGSINFEKAVFVDVRTPGEFKAGSFKDAINIPVNELGSRLNELDKSDQVVVFCKSGARASSAEQILKSNGFSNVVNGINTSHLQSLKNQ